MKWRSHADWSLAQCRACFVFVSAWLQHSAPRWVAEGDPGRGGTYTRWKQDEVKAWWHASFATPKKSMKVLAFDTPPSFGFGRDGLSCPIMFCVLVCAARTLSAAAQPRVTLSRR